MSWERPGSAVMETVHHRPERQQEGSHMLFGLHRESSSGHAGQTRRWGDVLGAVPGEGARDAPSLFRARRNGHSGVHTWPGDQDKTIDREDHQRFTIRVPAGLGFPSYCQKVTDMVSAEPADGVDPMFRAPQLSRFKSDGLLCVERGWIEGQWTSCSRQRHSQAPDYGGDGQHRHGGGSTCVRVLPDPYQEGHRCKEWSHLMGGGELMS